MIIFCQIYLSKYVKFETSTTLRQRLAKMFLFPLGEDQYFLIGGTRKELICCRIMSVF